MNSNLNADYKTIFELDLDPIKVKLMHEESGEGWSRAQVDAVEFEYRRFLCLIKLFPHEEVAPLFDTDIFWHYHILDTMKYAADCEQIFGYFLHHFPYTGLRGEDDEVAHRRVGARMQELYEATFGEAYIRQEENLAARAITAFSMPNTVAAAKTAFSMPNTVAAAKTAFSMPNTVATAKTAFSMPNTMTAAKTAFSMPNTVAAAKTAFSMPNTVAAAKTAFSMPNTVAAAKTAFSMPNTAASGKGATSMPSSNTVARNDTFFTARPTLAKAA
jgi:hypothetical protein